MQQFLTGRWDTGYTSDRSTKIRNIYLQPENVNGLFDKKTKPRTSVSKADKLKENVMIRKAKPNRPHFENTKQSQEKKRNDKNHVFKDKNVLHDSSIRANLNSVIYPSNETKFGSFYHGPSIDEMVVAASSFKMNKSNILSISIPDFPSGVLSSQRFDVGESEQEDFISDLLKQTDLDLSAEIPYNDDMQNGKLENTITPFNQDLGMKIPFISIGKMNTLDIPNHPNQMDFLGNSEAILPSARLKGCLSNGLKDLESSNANDWSIVRKTNKVKRMFSKWSREKLIMAKENWLKNIPSDDNTSITKLNSNSIKAKAKMESSLYRMTKNIFLGGGHGSFSIKSFFSYADWLWTNKLFIPVYMILCFVGCFVLQQSLF